MNDNVETWSGKARADENFPVGSALIAARLRPEIHAYYAFARNADDIADSAELAPDDKLRRLDVMEGVLLGHAETGSPSALGLRASLARCGLSPRHATDLLVAFRRDATKLRYASWEELLDYCRFSAMPVGRHVLALHGESEATFPASDALCAALQVLNHLQDIQKDLAQLGRCYLPQDLMARHGTGIADIARPAASRGMRRVIDALLDQCDALNHVARALPPAVRDRRLRLETAVIVGLAERLAARLRRADPLAKRVKLSRLDAVAAMLGALEVLVMAQTDPAEVEAIVRAAGTSFHRGMAILPPARRQAMYAIYAFCRIVDDIADEESSFAARKPRLDAWRGRIAALYDGRAEDAVTRELGRAIAAFALRREDFEAVIDGMAMDAETAIVAPDEATLDLYCDRVAAAVGRLSVRAFGDASPAADQVAHHLGRALQLTNILRDIHEDAGRGRLYLPCELLDGAGIARDPAAALIHKALPRVCETLATRAHGHFREAAAGMARCDRRAMKPARLMGATYAAILSRLERRGWQRLDEPVKLSKWVKLRIAARHLLF